MSEATTLELVPLSKIVVDETNPRTVNDDLLDGELAESVKQDGVLQPILVKTNGKGKFHLVDGSRRLRAAKTAKLKEIPALVRPIESSRIAALVANLQRKDLTPLEEAEALHALQEESGESARAIAKRLGKSNDYVSDRLRLVKLPDPVKAAVSDGTIGLHAVPAVARLAEVAPKTAAALVDQVSGDRANYNGRDLEDTGLFLEVLDEAMRDEGLDLWSMRGFEIKELATEDAAALSARYNKAKSTIHGYSYGSSYISFDQDDVDAAGAFGCLFSIEDTDWQGRTITHDYVTDPHWLADRVALKVEALEREAAKVAKKTDAKSGGASPSADVASGDKDAIAKAKEERRKEREKEERARITARGRNLDLGVKTAKAFKAPKLTADMARCIAEFALAGRLDVAVRGLRYVDERLQTVEVQKNGKEKITYADNAAAAKLLQQDLDKAKTPEEILGVVLRALTAATYASEDVVAQSHRYPWTQPGGYNHKWKKLLAKVAGKHVPQGLKARTW